MKSLNVNKNRVLSVVLLSVAVSTAEARVGFSIVAGPQADQHQRQAPTQPAQADPFEPQVADFVSSPIVSQVAVPLGGNTPDQQFLPGTLTVSPDSSNVAYRIRYGNGLGFDGYIYGGHKPIGANRATNPTFSPDSKAVSLVVADRGWKLRQGKTFIEGYEPVTAPRYSPDGERIVYLARLENQRFIVEGDQSQPMAQSIGWDQLVFTPDSAVLAYPAFDGQHWRMVINGDPGPDWDSFTSPPLIAPQGSRVVYIATKNGRYHVVDRHTPAPQDAKSRAAAGFRLIDQPPVFSADGRAFAYWALGDDLVWRVYQNHVPMPGYEAERPGQLVLNEDGQTLIAILKRGQDWYVVNNGQPGTPYVAVGKNSLTLSADGARLAYAVKKSRGWAVVENDTEHPVYTTIAANSLRFSPDSKRFIYAALSLGQWSVIEPSPLNTSESMTEGGLAGLVPAVHQSFNKITTRSLSFSPDSQHLAYIAYNASAATVVRNQEVLGEYDHAQTLTFSPDNKRLVWLATDKGQSFLVVNGTPSTETFDGPVPGSHIHFVNNLLCHTAVIRRPGPTFARIELKLSVPEVVPTPEPDDAYDPDTTPVPVAPVEHESPFVVVPTE